MKKSDLNILSGLLIVLTITNMILLVLSSFLHLELEATSLELERQVESYKALESNYEIDAEYNEMYLEAKDKMIDKLSSELIQMKLRVYNSKDELELLESEIVDLMKANGLSGKYLDDRQGTYYIDTADVELYLAGASYDRAKDVALHEIGHYVWFELLTKSERQEYTDVYDNATFFPSDYSKTNVDEDFAEMFMFGHKCYFDVSSVSEDRQLDFLWRFA